MCIALCSILWPHYVRSVSLSVRDCADSEVHTLSDNLDADRRSRTQQRQVWWSDEQGTAA